MAGVSSIDKLPEIERLKVIKELTEAGERPDYRAIIRKLNLKCSHMSLWRYHRSKVKPALERSLQTVKDCNYRDKGDSLDTRIDMRKEAQSVTRQVLADDPILQAVEAKRRRMEQAIAKALESENYDAYSKLESVDLRALETQAKAMMHPGFVVTASPQAGANLSLVVVMPGLRHGRHDGEIIEIKPVEE